MILAYYSDLGSHTTEVTKTTSNIYILINNHYYYFLFLSGGNGLSHQTAGPTAGLQRVLILVSDILLK